MTRQQSIAKLLTAGIVILAISALLIYLENLVGIDRIREYMQKAGVWGPVIYIFLHLLTHIFAPIQGTPLFLASFALFGRWAIVYTYLVSAISSITNFWIARSLGRKYVAKLAGKEAMAKIDKIASNQGITSLVVMRVFQGFISDFVSYAAGLTSIKFPAYYLISLLAPLPYSLAWFLLYNRFPPSQVFAWAMVSGSIAFVIPPAYYFLKWKLKLKNLNDY